MNDINDFEYNNEEEAEMAQLQSIHMHLNAIGDVQRKLAEQRKFVSLSECAECGEDIPEARQKAIPGVQLCIHCQTIEERRSKGL
jgi:phage/conjugal plasmid C-4 type zinc finger TraR family protein